MRHRVALALLVATCAARCASSTDVRPTSLDDRLNKKTETGEEDVNGDDGIEESRMFGMNTVKSFFSKAFGGTKNVAAKDDALVNAAKNAGAKVDDVGGGMKNAAKKADDVGDDAMNAVKKGGEVAKVAKKPWSGKKKAMVFILVAGVLGGIAAWLYNESQKPAVAPTAGGSTATLGTTGSAMEGSSSLAMDSSSGSIMDGSSSLAMDDVLGSGKGGFSDSMLDEMAATGYSGA